MFSIKNRVLRFNFVFFFFLLVVLTGCSGDEDDPGPTGGISGTGYILEGTVQKRRLLAVNQVQAKAGDQIFQASVGNNGQFSFSDLTVPPPYLLKVDFTSGAPFYALTYTENGRQNIHAYSDLTIQNWYAAQGLVVSDVFEGTIDIIPSVSELQRQNEVISNLIDPVLVEYDLGGTDLSTVLFQSDDQGIDEFLDSNPVVIINGDVNIIITQPGTDLQTSITNNLPLGTNLSLQDVNPPAQPGTLRALPSGNSEIVLAWDASIDDVAVSEYEILRNGVLIGMSTFPSFIDSTVVEGIVYAYAVVAIDSTGNRSIQSEPAVAEVSVDVTPPPAPENLTFEETENSIRVSWDQQSISDVSSFIVLSGSDMVLSSADLLANTTSTFAFQTDLPSGTQFCYQVIAVDGSDNRSEPSVIACVMTEQEGDAPPTPITPAPPPPAEATIVGAWGGVVTSDMGDIPFVIDIELDSEGEFGGSFFYPTLSLCDGSIDFIFESNQTYEVSQDGRFPTGDCRLTARATLNLTTSGSEQVLEYQYFDPSDNTLSRTGTLRRRTIASNDMTIGTWGGIVSSALGDIPVVFNVEATANGSLTGDFLYPTLTLCDGSLSFVSRLNQTYEFFEDGRFPTGDCRSNARVNLSLTTVGSEQVLEYQYYDSNTNTITRTGTLRRRSVIPNDMAIGSWGGIVSSASGDIPVLFNIEATAVGGLSGDFLYPTLTLCDGSLNFVTGLNQTYEFFEDGRFPTGDCRLNARVNLTLTTVGSEQIFEYQYYDSDTNIVTRSGMLRKRQVSTSDLIIGSWGGLVSGVSGDIPVVINIEATANGSLSGDFEYPTLTLCEGTFNFVTNSNLSYEFFEDGRFPTGDCRFNARVNLTSNTVGSEQVLDYMYYDPSDNTVSRVGVLRRR